MSSALLATYVAVAAGAESEQPPGAFQLERQTEMEADTNDQETSNRFEFISGAEAERHWAKLREQLQDPEQRKRLWAQHRAALAESHPELGDSIGIDGETEQRLLDLLADHQLDELALTIDTSRAMQERADFETRRLQSLRDLLGEEGAQRYRQYTETLPERREVARLNDMLPAADKLRADQKSQLMALFGEELRRRLDMSLRESERRSVMEHAGSLEEMQRSMELQTIADNERSLRNMQDGHRALLEKTRTLLSASQQAALTQIKQEEERALRLWIEQARTRAGLSAAIPERAEPPRSARPKRIPLVTHLSLEFTVKVNRAEPKSTKVTVSNGSPVMIEGGDGLWIEATPTLYDDHRLVIETSYYEEEPNGEKRLIHKGGSFSSLTQLPDGSRAFGGGGGGHTLVGRKGYAVEIMAKML